MENLIVMNPELQDAGEITDLIVLCDIADHGAPDITLSDLLVDYSLLQLYSTNSISEISVEF